MSKLIRENSDFISLNWIVHQLKNLLKGLKILDAVAGEGKFKKHCKHLDYTSQDLRQYDGKSDYLGSQTDKWYNSKLDIKEIPTPDRSFDFILLRVALEHISDALETLRKINRILKDKGIILLTTPFNSLTHFAPYHFCGYNKYWYSNHSFDNNFEIEILKKTLLVFLIWLKNNKELSI